MFLYIFIIVWAIFQIFLTRWVYVSTPPKNIVDKYSKKVQFLSKAPFGFGWKKSVHKEDLSVMERYQFRTRIWFLGILLHFFVLFTYVQLAPYISTYQFKKELEELKQLRDLKRPKEQVSFLNQK